jgi:crotonobetainyl-CoA:carnitine CoA-transferase CaiB-like acyl-CoA transferase
VWANDKGGIRPSCARAFVLSRTPSKMAARPPEFGEQTNEILAEFGFTDAEITELKRARAV